MGVHIFTKIKIKDGWKTKKNIFFSYFISGIPQFSNMGFFTKCSMFRRSILLNGIFLHFYCKKSDLQLVPEDFY